MCQFCKGKLPIVTHYGKFEIDELLSQPVIICGISKCPPYVDCCNKDMNVKMTMKINYCPICGRKLVEE